MKLETFKPNKVLLSFDLTERKFLEDEANKHHITVERLIEMIFGVLFIGGYSKIIGKE